MGYGDSVIIKRSSDGKDLYIDDEGNLGINLRAQSLGALSGRVVLVSGDTRIEIARTSGDAMVIQNIGLNIAYVGGSNVTSSTYVFKLTPRQIFTFGFVEESFSFYTICEAGRGTSMGVGEYA